MISSISAYPSTVSVFSESTPGSLYQRITPVLVFNFNFYNCPRHQRHEALKLRLFLAVCDFIANESPAAMSTIVPAFLTPKVASRPHSPYAREVHFPQCTLQVISKNVLIYGSPCPLHKGRRVELVALPFSLGTIIGTVC